MKKFISVVVFIFTLMGCQSTGAEQGQTQWDFDHQIQFKEQKKTDGSYHIEVIAHNETRFEILATFLLRRSLELCQSYGFNIEVLKGVEGFNDKLGLPNMIMPSLAANVYCSKK